MPVGFQGVPDLDLEGFIFFTKTWSKCASGQIASGFEFFQFKKCSTGGFLSLETFFWFPLLTALSGQFFFNEQNTGVMQNFSEIVVRSLVQLFNALLIQHPVRAFGNTSSGG